MPRRRTPAVDPAGVAAGHVFAGLTAMGLTVILASALAGAYLGQGGPEAPQPAAVSLSLSVGAPARRAPPRPEPVQAAAPAQTAHSRVAGESESAPDEAREAALARLYEEPVDSAALADSVPSRAAARSEAPRHEAREAALARLYEEPVPTTAPAEEPVQTAAPAEHPIPTAAPAEHPIQAAVPAEASVSGDSGEATRLAWSGQAGVGPPERPPWQRYAVPVTVRPGRPMIAVVLDDLGLNRPGAWRAIALPGPLTLSFMTYAAGLDGFAAEARAAGHELLLHVPMEPSGASYDPGPNVLRAGLPDAELRRRLDWALDRLDGVVGINNHMGSKFTASAEGLALVMRELKARGLLFLDSVTSARSVGALVAERAGVPHARRDVFLDNEWNDPRAIRAQLARLEAIAERQGYAVGIGHPHPATLDVLAEWLPRARARGYALVPISAIVRHRTEVARNAGGTAG